MDVFNKDGKVDIYPNIFDGKTDEEIIELCEQYLGPFKERYFENKLIEQRGKYSRALAIDNLCDAIREMREDKMDVSVEDRESVLKDFGMTGARTPLAALASRVIQEEATEIVRQGFGRSFSDEPMDKVELERRINLVMNCCGKDTLNILIQKTIPRFYYGEDSNDIDDVERINKDLPQFFQAVDFLTSSGIDISKIEMEKGMNLQDVYVEVSKKYAKFFSKENKEEKVTEEPEVVNEPKSEVQSMVNESTSDNLDQADLIRQIQENQRKIQELVDENNRLIAKMVEKSNQMQR